MKNAYSTTAHNNATITPAISYRLLKPITSLNKPTKHPDPFTEAKGYNGPVLLLRADDDRLVDEGTCSRYAQVYTAPEVDTIAGGGHNFATLAARATVEKKTAAFIKANL